MLSKKVFDSVPITVKSLKKEKEDDAMKKIMTPSKITKGQIAKMEENFSAALRKSNLQSEPTQLVLEKQGEALTAELLAVVKKYVDAASNIIVRCVRVDRSFTPQQMIEVTGRVQYTDKSAVATMLKGEGEEVNIYFFKPRPEVYNKNGWLSEKALEQEFKFHGLKPDPYAQAQANADDPVFADDHPNGTHWKDDNGRWCFAAFSRRIGERSVHVRRIGDVWAGRWWFGGVRK